MSSARQNSSLPAQGSSAPKSARKFWLSVEELADNPNFETWLEAEFPLIANTITSARRREFLKLMGASLLLAGMAGCQEDTSGTAIPYVRQPEGAAPDKPQHFATAIPFNGYGQPVLATVFDGRPTKLDGNPDHPVTRGASDPFMQAAVLELYDPDRSKTPIQNGEVATWEAFARAMGKWRQGWTAKKGEGLRIVMGQTTSPTIVRLAREFLDTFPAAQIHVFEPIETEAWTKAVFGRRVGVRFQFDQCDTVVSFDHDLLGPGLHQVANARGWSFRRGSAEKRIRLHVAEPSPTITGSVASSRFIASAARVSELAKAIAAEFQIGTAPDSLSEQERGWITAISAELKNSRERSIVAAGASQPEWVHALTAKINEVLGNAGKTIRYIEPVTFDDPRLRTLSDLAADANAGKVETLLCLDSNPAYAAAGDLGFAEVLKKIRRRIHLGLFRDETGTVCEWHLPLSHALESWNDLRALDGQASIAQPLVNPLYDGRTLAQFFSLLTGSTIPDAEAPVRATWQPLFGADFEQRWQQLLRDGFIKDTEAKPADVKAADIATQSSAMPETSVEIIFRPDPTVWDGRFANNGWLQELPKPLLTTTWGNVIAISPQLAKEQTLENGDRVELAIDDRKVTGPVWILPGQAARTLTVFFGYGRTRAGELGNGHGYNAYIIRPTYAWRAAGSLRKARGHDELSITQLHHRMEGFDFVREVTDENPSLPRAGEPGTLYPKYGGAEHAWAMAIDLDLCIGCNACVAACTAENNVPVVGPEEVARGREMHWIRIARYYTGSSDAPKSYFQPVPCMHCEDAPCEMGCPVHATVHSPEGLNQMVYNRCIGTRTCSSFCPYKVRRFNWFDYRTKDSSPLHAAHNPDVTVRSRGVMEKCTYCTQRIEGAKAAAHIENRALRRDEVVTACQAACPTQAIIFGDLNDKDSAVSVRRNSGRHYALLEELGTKPRTTYLARWTDEPRAKGEKKS